MKQSIDERKAECLRLFASHRPIWHLWTPENNEIIFTDTADFRTGMSIMAFAARVNPEIKIITFELMTNHLHAVVSGSEKNVKTFFEDYKSSLRSYCRCKERTLDFRKFKCGIQEIETLDYLRNVIVYNNRNGFLVDENETPFSYPWGANRFYFNREAKLRHTACLKEMNQQDRRSTFHSRRLDQIGQPLILVDNYVTPMCFCHIELGESFFLNARQYHYLSSRNIESMKVIADSIGDRIYYTDDELYSAVFKTCKKKYDAQPNQLPNYAKLEMARTMHFDYNASNKQIARMLRMEIELVSQLFPE